MTTALDSFNEYMAAPCHELDERDAGRNDPHSQCFDEWGVPREMLFWLWEAAMRAAAQPSRAEVLEEAAKLCDLAFENVAPGHGGSYEEGCRDAFDLAGSQIRALKEAS
jgi:hypothetical protein